MLKTTGIYVCIMLNMLCIKIFLAQIDFSHLATALSLNHISLNITFMRITGLVAEKESMESLNS